MQHEIENLKESLRQLEAYNDPTTAAIKALGALVLSAVEPKPAKVPNAPETPKA